MSSEQFHIVMPIGGSYFSSNDFEIFGVRQVEIVLVEVMDVITDTEYLHTLFNITISCCLHLRFDCFAVMDTCYPTSQQKSEPAK